MRFLMRISWDVEAGNAIVRSGKLGQVVQSILADQKPEAAYFTAEGASAVASWSSISLTCLKFLPSPNHGS
jgi:hypothetical protein